MACKLPFQEEEMEVDNVLGYPKAYSKLCRLRHLHNLYNQGPPFFYIPYVLPSQEVLRADELDRTFPVVTPREQASVDPKVYVSHLWKQLNHLGNAGFDPEKFRVDPYGNVLYFHADSGSPLAWDIDHWFPCSRGGKTVPYNLRILQRQVCKRKHNKLEFLVPWWDLQLGISVNQFLSIFDSSNMDFRNRAFAWLFLEGENEELNDSQVTGSHTFPQQFVEEERYVGPAPAAVVFSHSVTEASALESIDLNRNPRLNCPPPGLKKYSLENGGPLCQEIQCLQPKIFKENENLDMGYHRYLSVAMARDSLKSCEEARKRLMEMEKWDDELRLLRKKNEEDRLALQDLELTMIRRKRRVEKSRRLAEAQSSYKASLERMVRDAMHQDIIYKEQVRLTQAANSALMARLEAQKAICDSSKKDLQNRLKQRNELEDELKPFSEQARKRSRVDVNQHEEKGVDTAQQLTTSCIHKPWQKELRVFLEEERRNRESSNEGAGEHMPEEEKESKNLPVRLDDKKRLEEIDLDNELRKLVIMDNNCKKADGKNNKAKPDPQLATKEDEEEYMRQIGKVNIDKWLKMLLENTEDGLTLSSVCPGQYMRDEREEDSPSNLNHMNMEEDVRLFRCDTKEDEMQAKLRTADNSKMQKDSINVVVNANKNLKHNRNSDGRNIEVKDRKEKALLRCESARVFRPSSPAVLRGMKKGVDCIMKKPTVVSGEQDHENGINPMITTSKSVIKSCSSAIKKAVKR